MFPARVPCGFFVRLLLAFIPLILLWPAVSRVYGKLLRQAGNALVGFGSEGRIRFSTVSDGGPHHDTKVVVVDHQARTQRSTTFSSRKYGYMPTTLVLALIVATPIPWSRRWRAVLWGLLWVHVYVAVRLVFLPDAYAVVGAEEPRTLHQLWIAALGRLYFGMDASTAGWMFVPVAIWALVTFRRGDWPGILQGKRSNTTTPQK